ncbi:uncharacterized protein LOC141639075 [Silene latifolia]|uniref:uncharacterized protein LOC141639075 n=1 Tax=Silene latifolia TaxID=37657 RepID=UPI003D76C91F
MRHARGEKRGVKRDRSMSSSVGTSTIPPPKKARKIKDWPRVQKHLKLHRKVFKECEHNRPLSSAESAMLGLKSKRRSSRMCSKRRSGLGTMLESRRATTASYRTAIVLSVLLAEDKITLYQAVQAVEKFDDDYDIHIRWLKMSRENKIKYVQDLR